MGIAFQDLSEWDLGIIKHLAVEILINTKETNRYVALTDSVVGCILAKGFSFQVDSKILIKTISKNLDDHTNQSQTADEIISLIFEYLKSNNIVIIKDETREATWSKKPSPSKYEPYYKPWMITWKN